MEIKKRNLGKIFVTGGDGFIGSHLVEYLLSKEYEVTALCLYNSFGIYGWLDEISKKSPKNLKLLLGDIRDSFFMEKALRGHDTVFHLASLIAIPYSYIAPKSYFETNLNGTLNVLQSCMSNKVKRLIHTSTSEVYGTAQFVPISEQHPLQGQSPYSASKIAADMAVNSFFCSYDVPVVTLRPFNTYGPRQSLRAVIPTIVAQVLSGILEVKVGNVKPTRDFNFVYDTVQAFYAVAEADSSDLLGDVFNCGSGVESTILDVCRIVEELTHSKINLLQESARMRPEKSEVARLVCDSAKLTKLTGWKSSYTLKDGISELVNWWSSRTGDFLNKSQSIYFV